MQCMCDVCVLHVARRVTARHRARVFNIRVYLKMVPLLLPFLECSEICAFDILDVFYRDAFSILCRAISAPWQKDSRAARNAMPRQLENAIASCISQLGSQCRLCVSACVVIARSWHGRPNVPGEARGERERSACALDCRAREREHSHRRRAHLTCLCVVAACELL